MPLSRLLYVSRCAMRQTGPERDAVVRELADRSAVRNAGSGLTGSLLHVGDHFVQVLEGPIGAIERTFEAICCDFRHDEVKLIDLVPVRERIFSQWSMALLGGGTSTALKLRDDLEEVHFLVGINAREAVSQMRRLLDHGAVEAEPV
ncbi:BLUF domain-containing protein [Novosphingobium sp. 9U]|uniref:BLUF domain-containing protein n=1 Tax=Novosphingobium sp. 9U TaxID=2653158 RepID=UPI0012F2B333|nr:BLUF domain-containing protein [Novosphingobium sp. 9U]VWX52990.1 BLUF domain-containing protein [Novosphingobium sp. 9U]